MFFGVTFFRAIPEFQADHTRPCDTFSFACWYKYNIYHIYKQLHSAAISWDNCLQKVAHKSRAWQIPDSKVHGANIGPSCSGSCRPQMGPVLAPRTLLAGIENISLAHLQKCCISQYRLYYRDANPSNWKYRTPLVEIQIQATKYRKKMVL